MSKRLIQKRIEDEARVASMQEYLKGQQIGAAVALDAARADRLRVTFQAAGQAKEAKKELEAAREAVETIRNQQLKHLYARENAE